MFLIVTSKMSEIRTSLATGTFFCLSLYPPFKGVLSSFVLFCLFTLCPSPSLSFFVLYFLFSPLSSSFSFPLILLFLFSLCPPLSPLAFVLFCLFKLLSSSFSYTGTTFVLLFLFHHLSSSFSFSVFPPLSLLAFVLLFLF